MQYGHELLEANIIGAIFWDPSLFARAADYLNKDMFRQVRHRNLFGMMIKLREMGEEINTMNIVRKFEPHLDTVGGIQYVTDIGNTAVSSHNLEKYIEDLMEQNARAKLSNLLEETKEIIADPNAGRFEELIDNFEQKALEIRPRTMDNKSNHDGIIEWYEDLTMKMADRSKAFGLMTGYHGIDALTLGNQRGDFFVCGARTSIGKSAFANAIADSFNERGYQGAMFSLEMSKGQIYNRFVSSKTKIPLQDLRTGNVPLEKLDGINLVMDKIKNIQIDDRRGISADYITGEMRRMKRRGELDYVIIDYLQEVQEGAADNDHNGSALHRICQKLRKAAQDCDCFVLGLSQIKQEVDVRQNKRPFISDLSGSAAIAAVADGIYLLYRDEYYNPDTAEPGIMEVNLAKQRNGPTGLVKLRYNKKFQTIENM